MDGGQEFCEALRLLLWQFCKTYSWSEIVYLRAKFLFSACGGRSEGVLEKLGGFIVKSKLVFSLKILLDLGSG